MKKRILAFGLSVSLIAGSVISVNAEATKSDISGSDRYETAAKIADLQTYDTAILVNADNSIADGLSASGLAGVENAPILLVKKDAIPASTLARIEKAKKIYLIGGTSSISSSIEKQLSKKNIQVERIQGNDRIQTSLNVATKVNEVKKVESVVFANGFKGEADAMSIAPVSARDGAPIVLTDGSSTSYKTKGLKSYVIGGSGSMSDNLVSSTNSERIGGINRFDTNKKIIQKFYSAPNEFFITKSHVLVDALTGSPIAKNKPIVLVDTFSDKSILNGATNLTTLGGLDNVTTKRCINATEPQDLYDQNAFNSEMSQIDSYILEMIPIEDIGIDGTSERAKSYQTTLQELYNNHLMINSVDNEYYDKVSKLMTQIISLNDAFIAKDLDRALSLTVDVNDTLTDICN